MASPQVLDFDQLLQPIAEDARAGTDLRSDPKASQLYYALKDARSNARSKERSGLIEGDDARELSYEWKPVLKQAQEILGGQSKDLEVAAWLIEALVRLEGFAGLRDGYRLVRELVEHFWDDIYPRPDEDGLETTVAPLSGLNGDDSDGTLILPIRAAMITGGQSVGPFATWHYEQAIALEQVADKDKREQRIEAGAVTLQTLQQAAAETNREEFLRLYEDLQQATDEFQQTTAALDERCGTDSPPSSKIRHALEACEEALRFLAGPKLSTADSPDEAVNSEGDAPTSGDGPATAGAAAPGQIRTREDAFRTILNIAEFFRRTEPHSPLSYSLERVVRWGQMPLPELLAALIDDDNARSGYFRLTGVMPPQGDQ